MWASLRPVVRELKLRLFLSLGRQPEVECFLVLPLLDCFCSSSKAGYGIWLLTVIDVLASEWLKRKTSNFRLPFVVEHRLCLISLLMPYPFVLFVPLFWLKFFQNIFHKKWFNKCKIISFSREPRVSPSTSSHANIRVMQFYTTRAIYYRIEKCWK